MRKKQRIGAILLLQQQHEIGETVKKREESHEYAVVALVVGFIYAGIQ